MNIKINEQQLKLVVEAMMDGFSSETLKSLTSFDKRLQYCKEMLGSPIGKGSSRIVFQIDDEKVLKLAFNQKGIAQNETEYDWGSQSYNCVPKLFDSDDNNFFIISEYVLPAKEQDFKHCFGFGFEYFTELLTFGYNRYARKPQPCRITDEQFYEILEKNENIENITQYMGDYNLPLGDLSVMHNYGLTYRDNQPLIVILDNGLTEEVWNTHYKKSNFIREDVLVHLGDDAKEQTMQQKWEDTHKCYHCGGEAYFSMSITDNVVGDNMIKIFDKDGNNKSGDLQAIALYYCPKCFKFTALNNMA